jgi:hypothetical protein
MLIRSIVWLYFVFVGLSVLTEPVVFAGTF